MLSPQVDMEVAGYIASPLLSQTMATAHTKRQQETHTNTHKHTDV